MIFNYGGVNCSQLSFSQLCEELKGVALVYIYDLAGCQGYCIAHVCCVLLMKKKTSH